ncbi:MAG: PhoH family protein [Owenweeksia sp.]|nr:PhoH family protein [Owenweeksia sp.]
MNLRLKAKALRVFAEDYETGKIKDVDSLYTGKTQLENVDQTLIDAIYKSRYINAQQLRDKQEGFTAENNHFYILKGTRSSTLAFYNPIEDTIDQLEKRSYYGIKPKNAEQTFALHAIANPEVRLVTLTGVAGTGKTLLALAGSLEQRRNFKQIYLARPIVPLSNKDLGYLPRRHEGQSRSLYAAALGQPEVY